MIRHAEFTKLQMADFMSPDEIAPLGDWELLDRIWIGEGYGFTEWLRPADRDDTLVSLSIDLDTFPAIDAVLRRIGLPLARGMELDQVAAAIGEPPSSEYAWTPERSTHTFQVQAPDAYDIECTLTAGRGLHYIRVEALIG